MITTAITFANVLKFNDITIEMENKNIKHPSEIKVKTSIAGVIHAMVPGDSVLFDAIEFGPIQTARAAVSRINSKLGRKEYAVSSENNGITYLVSRTKNEA